MHCELGELCSWHLLLVNNWDGINDCILSGLASPVLSTARCSLSTARVTLSAARGTLSATTAWGTDFCGLIFRYLNCLLYLSREVVSCCIRRYICWQKSGLSGFLQVDAHSQRQSMSKFLHSLLLLLIKQPLLNNLYQFYIFWLIRLLQRVLSFDFINWTDFNKLFVISSQIFD